MKMKLVYVHEDGQQELVTYFTSNKTVSIEQVLEQTNTDMNEWCNERGYEGYDFNALELVESDNIQLSLEYENATPEDATEIKEWIEFLIEEDRHSFSRNARQYLKDLTQNNIVFVKEKKKDDTAKWYELSVNGVDVIIIQDFTGDITFFINVF